MRTRITPAAVAVAAGLVLVAGPARTQTPPAPTPAPATSPAAEPDYATRPVAYINGNVPVTRQDLGEFLIARGGAEKVELLVNKMIIEQECKKKGVTVTDKELEAALMDDLAGLSIKKEEFVKVVLPRYGKTLYEWMEDVVRPRLLLTKLCRDRVKVDEADLKMQFEREYGEKRRVQMIMWPPTDDRNVVEKIYGEIRKSAEEFDRVARRQPQASLASSGGHVKPIGKHLPAENRIVEIEAFKLQPGDISAILLTSQGYIVFKLIEVVPPDAKVKWEDVKARMEKQAFDEKMSLEIPKYFGDLRKTADPKVVFTGPAAWRFDTTAKPVDNLIRGVGDAPVPPVTPAGQR